MIPNDGVWREPLEDLAASKFDERFMAMACVGLIGGFGLMMVVLGTFNFQFYHWALTTQEKTYIGFGAMIIGAAALILLTWIFIRRGPMRDRLDQSNLSDQQQRLAFALFYYQGWVSVRTWLIRSGLFVATAVAWADRFFHTQLAEGFAMTSLIFLGFSFYLVWAEFRLFQRLGSLRDMITSRETTPIIVGTIATIVGFLIIMPQLFGGASFLNVQSLGINKTGLAIVSGVLLVASEWSNWALHKLQQQVRLTDIIAAQPSRAQPPH